MRIALREDNELSKLANDDTETLRVTLEEKVPLETWVTGAAKQFHEEFYKKMDTMRANWAAKRALTMQKQKPHTRRQGGSRLQP